MVLTFLSYLKNMACHFGFPDNRICRDCFVQFLFGFDGPEKFMLIGGRVIKSTYS